MANKTSPLDGGHHATLQRGKACLRCRKRKMRCDGAKPACQQCARAKKGDACEYDDGKGKTRTQILRETIVRLEQRVRELEDPEYVSPAVTLFDPHTFDPQALRSFSESPPSSSYGSVDASFSAGHSPFPSESAAHSPESSWSQGVSASPPLFGNDMFFTEPQTVHPPVDLALMLLEIFTPHRHQCGLQIHMGTLKDGLNRSLAEQRHPVLMNAIYLWACFISRPEPLSQHEEHYLTMALDSLRDALREGHHKTLVDIVQASCLLATYFLANGRILEGSYHASAAAALAVQCGLQEPEPEATPRSDDWFSGSGDDEMKPLKMDLRHGERALAFWQVYNLDRCWSAVLNKATVIPDGNTPWPLDLAEYQAGALAPSAGVGFQTIKAFIEGDVASSGYSMQALRAKASALFERAVALAGSWDPRLKPSDTLRADVHSLEGTILAFIATLPPLLHNTLSPDDKPVLLTTHTLAHTALLHLFTPFASDDRGSYDKCARAARSCNAIIAHISEPDFAFLDPVVTPCWTAGAEALLRELPASVWNPNAAAEVRNELGTVMYALTGLAGKFPLAGIALAKVQKQLAEL